MCAVPDEIEMDASKLLLPKDPRFALRFIFHVHHVKKWICWGPNNNQVKHNATVMESSSRTRRKRFVFKNSYQAAYGITLLVGAVLFRKIERCDWPVH